MSTRNAMGARIRELREARGLSLDDMAAVAGISASHLSRIERGASGPSFPIAAAIARSIGVSVSNLAIVNREQAVINAQLVQTLVAAGMEEPLANEIQQRISTTARQALLETLTDV